MPWSLQSNLWLSRNQTGKTLMTVEQFEQLPREEAARFELDEGELVTMSGATYAHNDVRDRTVEMLRPFVREHGLGKVIAEQEFRLSPTTDRRPEVTFISNEKLALIRPEKRIQHLVPDLVIEIASDSDTFTGLMRKVRQYLDAGVRLVWIFNLSLVEITVFDRDGKTAVLRAQDTITADPGPPGSSCRVEQFFNPNF